MRLTLWVGWLAGLSLAAPFAPAENTKGTKLVRVTAKSVADQMSRFRAGADDRQLDHGGTKYSRMLSMWGREYLAQSFEIDHDFYRAAMTVGGLDELGPVVGLASPTAGDLKAASPWVTVVRQNQNAVERQTLAVGFRTLQVLGRPASARLVRVQRDYQLIGLGSFVRVRANGTDDVQSLTVQVGSVVSEFTSVGVMLGKILGFRATPTHLYVYTSANVGYEFQITSIDGVLNFTPSGQVGDLKDFLTAQTQRIPAALVPLEECQTSLDVH